MANRKISDLTALTAPVTGDLLPIVDISEAAAADKNKKITYGTFLSSVPLGTAAAPSIAFTGDNTGIYSPGADQLAISTSGAGRLFVSSAGVVNVKTTGGSDLFYVDDNTSKFYFSPNGSGEGIIKLDTANPIRFLNAGGERLRLTSTGALNFVGAGTAGSTQAVSFNGSAPVNSLVIDSSGRLGIGSSSPAVKLDVVGAGSFNQSGEALTLGASTQSLNVAQYFRNTSGYVVLALASAADQYLTGAVAGDFVIATNAKSLRLGNASTGALGVTLDSSNRLGINTTSPGTNLDVNGTVRMRIAGGGTDRYVDIGSDGSGTTRFYNNYAGGGDFGFTWKIGASDRMTLDSSGRLLVGTSSDSGGALLQVNGDRIRVGTAKTPASASDTGTAGEICWDASYIYVCTATNTWKRTAIATW